jgi:hypothetical protein
LDFGERAVFRCRRERATNKKKRKPLDYYKRRINNAILFENDFKAKTSRKKPYRRFPITSTFGDRSRFRPNRFDSFELTIKGSEQSHNDL